MADGQISVSIVAVAVAAMSAAITKLFVVIVDSKKAEIDRITEQHAREVARLEATIDRQERMLFKAMGAGEGFSQVAQAQASLVKQLHGEVVP